jgi:transglutaminase-like putative cysteine protease
MSDALSPTPFVDSDHPDLVAFAEKHTAGAANDTERAVKLYYAVRDGIRYDPYRLVMTVEGLRASTCLANGYGWCVTKASLLAAACRAVGIPARLGYADVRNHLSTARLREFLGTDVFYFHGYTSIFLDGKWVKATPAFNVELCEKFRIRSLEFDGTGDSIYHPFDLEGRRHMEYIRFRGEHDDVPLDEMIAVFSEHYSQSQSQNGAPEGDFDADVDEETRGLAS